MPVTLSTPRSVCSSNLTEFAQSESLHNWGPNITFIFIPGSLNCSDPTLARSLNAGKSFAIEIELGAPEETVESGAAASSQQYDCGQSVGGN